MQITAIYRKNFKPQIFTDITTPVKQSYSPYTGKLYDINSEISFNIGGLLPGFLS